MTDGEILGTIRAAVVYTTHFGTTEKIARALEGGLKRGGVRTICANVNDVPPESLKQYDLLCFGGPTEFMGLSRRMDEYMEEMRKVQLSGKLYLAFDTKNNSPFSGSAAKCIQNRAENQGLRKIAKRESAIVKTVRQGTSITGNILREGEEARFERIGYEIGKIAAEAASETSTSRP
jgi:flavodoxin